MGTDKEKVNSGFITIQGKIIPSDELIKTTVEIFEENSRLKKELETQKALAKVASEKETMLLDIVDENNISVGKLLKLMAELKGRVTFDFR
ncbi:MAG: hypothetical protein LIO87_02630 [Eubacterium sp.]|nr:hypothetical protein [Eubacterium sp.]